MSHTEQDLFLRWVLRDGVDLDALAARLADLGEGSLLCGPRSTDRCVDVRFCWEFYGQRPLIGVEDAMFRETPSIEAIWVRARSGFRFESPVGQLHDGVDGINQVDRHGARRRVDGWRPCRYGFDEILIAGAAERLAGFELAAEVQRWRGAGSYLAQNCSVSFLEQHESLPGAEIVCAEPLDALALASTGFTRIEWRWRGRTVHAANRRGVHEEASPFRTSSMVVEQYESADGWDNCVDDVYLERFGDPALLRPPDVYFRDRYGDAD